MSLAGWYTADLPPKLSTPVSVARALFALCKQALS